MSGPRTEVVIALGSNLGKRCRNLSEALKSMQKMGMEILRHSCLYETSPVGVKEQPHFLNAAVLATTKDDPVELIQKLKGIEKQMGRVFDQQRYGPRLIDLDVIFYGNSKIDMETCTVPHPRWKERDFVKFPLGDLARSYARMGMTSVNSVREKMDEVQQTSTGKTEEEIRQVFDFGRERIEEFGKRTWMMHVLNVTPDSFSDGGQLLSKDDHQINERAILASAERAIARGAQILDIGGQSTRPGSSLVSAEAELARVLPVIKLLRSSLGDQCPYLSVDTFYASVAHESIAAGADIINDISGGKRDPQMLKTVADADVPIVLMHMRGTPQTMTKKENTTYSADPVYDIAMELQECAEAAMEHGIPAWRILLDPGIGFAKAKEVSFQTVLELHRLKGEIFKGSCAKMPLLVGVSRKRFLSHFTGDKAANERDLVSCATAMDCIRNGADILRVHNSEMAQEVFAVADALYRTRKLP